MGRFKIPVFIVLGFFVLTLPVVFRPKAVLTAVSTWPAPEKGAAATIGQSFVGEELDYRIGFWLFDDAAVGKLKLERGEDGTYVVSLTAQTTGVLGWFLRYRKDSYTALIEEVDGGGSGRFRTITFEKNIDIGGKVTRGITWLDYEKGLMTWKKWKRGKLRRSGELPMEPGVFYDDPLTAFYNFRFGVYGPIEEGREYLIKTFPKSRGKEVDIHLRLATESEFERLMRYKEPFEGYFAYVRIDKELFGSKTGNIEMLFSEDLVPVEGVAKDMVLFGDVRGKLVKEVPPQADPGLVPSGNAKTITDKSESEAP